MPGSFKGYMENIKKDTGKEPDDYYKMAEKVGFIKKGKVVSKHSEILSWLKTEVGLGHVRANFIILYFKLKTNDENITSNMKKWAYNTGYKEYTK